MTKTKLSRDWVLQIGLQTARAGWALLIMLAMAAAVMRERLKELGGRLEIESDSTGTLLKASVPLPETV
jgi:hypothetical protein